MSVLISGYPLDCEGEQLFDDFGFSGIPVKRSGFFEFRDNLHDPNTQAVQISKVEGTVRSRDKAGGSLFVLTDPPPGADERDCHTPGILRWKASAA